LPVSTNASLSAVSVLRFWSIMAAGAMLVACSLHFFDFDASSAAFLFRV
jgi:hypothetical protein